MKANDKYERRKVKREERKIEKKMRRMKLA